MDWSAPLYRGPERRTLPRHIMTVPGTSGRIRFDGTIGLGHILIILPLLTLIFAAGAWKASMEDAGRQMASQIAFAMGQERIDVQALRVQIRTLSDRVATEETQIGLLEEDVRAFARSVGAPIPAKSGGGR